LNRERKEGTCGTHSNVEYPTRATADSFEIDERDNSESEDDTSESSAVAEIPETTQSFSRGSNRVLLPQAESERLGHEGRCFKCKAKGHLSRDCEDQQKYMVEKIEAQAVRFTAYETVDQKMMQKGYPELAEAQTAKEPMGKTSLNLAKTALIMEANILIQVKNTG
jgi:hypothetical protein